MGKNKTKLIIVTIFLLLLMGSVTYFVKISSEPKTLTIGVYTGSYWDIPQGDSYHMIDYAIRKFKERYPNIRVIYGSGIIKTNYRSWLAANLVKGTESDIFIVPTNTLNILASNGVLLDLNGYIRHDKFKTSDFYQAALENGQYYNQQLALPFEVSPSLMVVDISLLARAKLKIPNFNWQPTQPELLNKKLRQKDYYGVTENFNWQAAADSYQGQLFASDGAKSQLTSNKVMQGLNLIAEIVQLSNNVNVTSAMSDQGKVAFSPTTLAQYRIYTSYPYHVTRNPNFDWDVIKMSSMNKKSGTKLANVSSGISSHSHNATLAWQFMKLLVSKGVQTELIKYSQGVSPLKKIAQSTTMKGMLVSEGSNLTTQKLNAILSSGSVEPKFKKYYSVMDNADYQVENGLQSGKLETEIFEMQNHLNEELK